MTDVNQGLRQSTVRGITATTGTHNEDWHALFDLHNITAGLSFDDRFKAWLDQQLGTTHGTLPDAMTAFAQQKSSVGDAEQWNDLGQFNYTLNFAGGDFSSIKPGTGPTGDKGWYRNSAVVYVQEADNTPYSIYQRESGVEVSKGMPVFGSMTNLAIQSQTLGTSWGATNGTVTDNDRAAPDGTTTAEKFTADGGGQSHLSQPITVTNAKQQLFSCFARYVDNQWIAMRHAGFTNTPSAYLDVLNIVAGSGEHADIDTFGIIDVSGGWSQPYCSMTSTDTGANARMHIATADGTLGTPAANQDIHLWGVMYFDDPAFSVPPPFYIPTTTTAITRTADDPELDTPYLPLFAGEYVNRIKFNADYIGQGSNRVLFHSDDGDNTDEVLLHIDTADKLSVTIRSGGAEVADITGASAISAGENAVAYRIQDGAFSLAHNGSVIGTPDTSGAVPAAATRLHIAHNAGASHGNCMIADTQHSRNLSDANLLAMSVA